MLPHAQGSLMTHLSPETSLIQGVLYEIIYTSVYTWIYFASRNSRDTFKGFSGPLAMGIFYAISHVMIVCHLSTRPIQCVLIYLILFIDFIKILTLKFNCYFVFISE